MSNITNDHIYQAGADAEEWVRMTHPDLDRDPEPVTRRAFEQVWRHKGFTLVEELGEATAPPATAAPQTLSGDDYDSHSREELVGYANAHGANLPKSASKTEAWDALVAANLAAPRQEA